MRQARQRNTTDSVERVVLLPARPPVAFIQIQESLEDIEESSADFSLLFWILGLLFFGLGDTISSFLVFSQGGVELNPIMRWSLSLPGGLLGFVFVKTLALSVLYMTSYIWHGAHRWMIPLIMTAAGVYLTTNNMLHYLGFA